MKYKIIYADPPWTYDNPKGNNPAMGGITYPTMTEEQIYCLPIKEIADADSALFLWATMPKLPQAIQVISKWGFKFITVAFVWVKQNPNADYRQPTFFYPKEKDAFNIYSGLGHWTNGNAELVLMGKRGSPKRQTKNVKQIILEPRSRHSAKPQEARNRIVRLMGDVARIELFAREREEGWAAWGNEIKSDIELTECSL